MPHQLSPAREADGHGQTAELRSSRRRRCHTLDQLNRLVYARLLQNAVGQSVREVPFGSQQQYEGGFGPDRPARPRNTTEKICGPVAAVGKINPK
jgi:hypothetical protein